MASIKRFLTRRNAIIFKTSQRSREEIEAPVAASKVGKGDPSDLTVIKEENDVDEIPQPVPSVDDTSGPGQVDAGSRLPPKELSTWPTLPSSPSRSDSTSTQGSVRALSALNPPPYSDYDESWSPGLSTHSTIGEAGSSTTIGAAEQIDNCQKSKRMKDEEEEVEDRAELPRMIAHLTATENEDWALVLELCERASASEANAKEAVKELRWEFKYAEPSAQFSAAQLWAIMFRNSSKTLLEQVMSQKFLENLEDVLTSPRTPTIVKERFMEVLGAVVYACGSEIQDARSATSRFCELWHRLKSPSDPEEGVPFDVDNEILNPSTPRATSLEPEADEQLLYQHHEPPFAILGRQRSVQIPQRERSIQVPRRQRSVGSRNSFSSLDEEMRRIFQECRVAQSNANLLLGALSYARSQDLEKEFIQEFRVKCRASQQLIAAQIPRANIDAQRSRSVESSFQLNRRPSKAGSVPRNLQLRDDGSPIDLTVEEELLAALVAADGALQEALRVYDDLARFATERRAEELSQRFVRTDRKRRQDQGSGYHDTHEAQSDVLGISPTISRNMSLSHRARSTPNPGDSTFSPSDSGSQTHHSFVASAGTANVPEGSRTPSPERADSTIVLASASMHHSRADSLPSTREYSMMHKNLEQSDIGSNSFVATEGEVQTPSRHRVSTKAFGKRRALDREYPHEQINADETTRSHVAQFRLLSLSPQSPENALNYNPWNTSSTDLSSSGSFLPPTEPTDTPDSSIFVTPNQNALQLLDFTGKIEKEGEYAKGRGGFADVWQCVLHLPSGKSKVAVKVLQTRACDSELEQKISKRIRREITIWQGLKHENVLPLLGITAGFGRYMSLVSPWLENGSLMQYLDRNCNSLGVSRRLELACEVAAGLSYLHSSQVVHGDLTGANVLITDQGKACLCDFGLSTLMIAFHGTSFYTSTVGGNARWAAPELFCFTDSETPRSLTVQSDVYSFGCILLEILSGQVPYYYLVREEQVLMALHKGIKPNRPTDAFVTDTHWHAINACWAMTPRDRPTMEKVLKYIKHQQILENLPT